MLVSMLIVSGVLFYALVLLQTWKVSLLLASQEDRISGELTVDTNDYLHKLLRKHDLSPRVEWAAWNILSTQSQEKWTSLTRVPHIFRPSQPEVFDSRGEHPPSAEMTSRTLTLPSPRNSSLGQSDASRFLFGVCTTYERLMENDRAILRSWQRWLTDGQRGSNGAHLVVNLASADGDQMRQIKSALEEMDIPATVYHSGEQLSAASRYAQLAGALHAYASALSSVYASKRWFALIDDDVFFPSLSRLEQKLGMFDAQDQVYIGAPGHREDWEGHHNGTPSASGGGGVVILSRRGLGRYIALACAERRVSGSSSRPARQWASTFHECLSTRGGQPMDALPGLDWPTAEDRKSFWTDARDGDGRRPLALRSRPEGKDLDAARAHLVADACGEDCFLQRFLFRDGWVLVNGVSISQYLNPLPTQRDVELRAAAGATREGPAAQLQLAPGGGGARGGGGGGARNVWHLLDSSVDDYGVVWQAYVKRDVPEKRAPTAAGAEALDSIIILIWDKGKRGRITGPGKR
ncbi:hypothetical protein V2A60_003398 [Cordyceps javanica]|uniref:Glycosyltransferase family 31 protein n=1 Tax=Cordyceps javanica TaxID=43265 RepID=A0A545V379_9HYPO|nr:glycosyltransferase family 31 protein [Cordyceps javanica]TQW07461.1 glycosyltransferase family 31 protein [Cordyceps javanica]